MFRPPDEPGAHRPPRPDHTRARSHGGCHNRGHRSRPGHPTSRKRTGPLGPARGERAAPSPAHAERRCPGPDAPRRELQPEAGHAGAQRRSLSAPRMDLRPALGEKGDRRTVQRMPASSLGRGAIRERAKRSSGHPQPPQPESDKRDGKPVQRIPTATFTREAISETARRSNGSPPGGALDPLTHPHPRSERNFPKCPI